MVKACHRAGIEVVLNLPFSEHIMPQMMEECLRYYVLEYHIDGFILNPVLAPMEAILADPLLKRTKILQNKEDFQITMRRFLKGDEGMVPGVMWWLKQQSKEQRSCNYITSHNGFTLADLVSYDGKHNEANGENNQDGPDYNYSWNCGAEGATRRKAVLELRKKQMRNAFFLLLMAQGTPCLLAGDEFANSQKGNNNVYCQDNETAWLNWKQLEKEKELFDYVRNLIALRKRLPILHSEKPLLGRDEMAVGYRMSPITERVHGRSRKMWRADSLVYIITGKARVKVTALLHIICIGQSINLHFLHFRKERDGIAFFRRKKS